MADKKNRLAINVEGPWYVDDTCIGCGLCGDRAPASFRLDPASGMNYVYHQPETDEENAGAEEAMESCPVEAIGNDG